MSVLVRIATPLRTFASGAATFTVEAARVSDLPRAVAASQPALAERIIEDGRFSRFVNVFVDGEDLRFLPADADLSSASEIGILPAISGGSPIPD